MAVAITSDKKWRNFTYGYELPKKWRKHFDWIKSDGVYDNSNFVKYRGWIYSIDEFMSIPVDAGMHGWDGIINETYFSGVVVKISSDGDKYKIGRYFVKGESSY